ncbi:MAG TPA: ATP-binding cassette domain-containing protein, partial [Casimicrobiaceae bacterium]|nr:ATP-binding cassette domain-containing protein [Casimicrobiaceae bacterium]
MRVDRPLVALVAGAAVLFVVPFLGLPAFYDSFLYLVFHWIVLATSWNILSGYSGYFSFGHGAFFGAGVYTTAVLAGKQDVPFLYTLPAAAVVAAALAVGLGAIVFRVRSVRGELFALLTLAVTFVLSTIVLNTPIDGGPGVYLSAVAIPKLAPTVSGSFYVMALVLAFATVLVARGIQRSRLGLALFAIHDDEDAAEVMGVPTYRYKLTALGVSAALAGVAGGIQAVFVSYVTANGTFNITVPLTVVLMSILGGTRHWAGPALGATAITILLYVSTAADQAVAGKAIVGAVLVMAVLLLPEGILSRFERRQARAKGTPAAIVHAMAGAASSSPHAPAELANVRHTVSNDSTKPLLSVRGAQKSFHALRALQGVDLDVFEGEILGVLGPNGSGKSTLINVISGHYRADAGTIVFAGENIARWPAHRIARAGIARTYQIPRPFAHLTVRDNVALTAIFGNAALSRDTARDTAHRWLEFTELSGLDHVRPGDLNLHETKFLELARALAARPRLLLLDEVLSGLTPTEIDEAVGLIRRIRDAGTTVVFVEHVMRAI